MNCEICGFEIKTKDTAIWKDVTSASHGQCYFNFIQNGFHQLTLFDAEDYYNVGRLL